MTADQIGAIVLCGGQSRRMGRPKAWLPVAGETMVQRVVRLVASRATIVVVSAAAGQGLPPLPPRVEIVRDPEPDRGPLRGLASGLAMLAGRVAWAFATAVDAPLLEPAWIDRLLELSEGVDLVLPHAEGRDQPLAALYRPEVAGPVASAILASGRGKLGLVRDSVRTRVVSASELADVDPGLRTLRNINTPADFDAIVGAI